MAEYLVMKFPNDQIVAFVHSQDREEGALMLYEPSQSLICVEEGRGHAEAESQAKSYWNGTHQDPRYINAWVERHKK